MCVVRHILYFVSFYPHNGCMKLPTLNVLKLKATRPRIQNQIMISRSGVESPASTALGARTLLSLKFEFKLKLLSLSGDSINALSAKLAPLASSTTLGIRSYHLMIASS